MYIMKATGIVRPIDKLGRIVIPKELRRIYGLTVDDSVEIFVNDDQIVIKKYEPACIFCNNTDGIVLYEGKSICKSCLEKINAAAKEVE
mgnify:FL=1|jgi:transcription regulator abrB